MPRKAAIMASRTIEKAVTGKSPMQARMRAWESRIQHRRCTAMIQMSMTGAARKVNARRPAELPRTSHQIGRASWRERVGQSVESQGVAVQLKKTKQTNTKTNRYIENMQKLGKH